MQEKLIKQARASIALVLAALAVAALLAGCGGGGSDNTTAAANSNETTGPEASGGGETTPAPDQGGGNENGGAGKEKNAGGRTGGSGGAAAGGNAGGGSGSGGGANPPSGSGSGSGQGGAGGGGRGAPSGAKATFVKQADAACAKGRALTFSRFKSTFKSGGSPSSPKARNAKLVEVALIPGLELQLRGLRALTPPPGDGDRVRAIVASIEALLAEAKRDPGGFVEAEQQYARSEELAREYGLQDCGGP